MVEEIIQRGAEAVLIKRGGEVLKRRVVKGYRLRELDGKIRKLRTRGEGRILEKAGKVVNVPVVKKADERNGEIEMEFIDGVKLSEGLDSMDNWKEVCGKIGEGIGKLHDAGIIHGDLTTSNLIWSNGELYFIDFGLSYGNGRVEDKAVDLHLIKQALEAKHFGKWKEYWKEIEKGYLKSSRAKDVLDRLVSVERRGRYKGQY